MSQHNPHRRQRSAFAQPSSDGAGVLHARYAHAPQLVESAIRSAAVARSSLLQYDTHDQLSESSEVTVGTAAPLSLSHEEQRRFHALYREHFDFVFRNLRRLGVPAASTDDALQEVYLVVLRRLRALEHDSHVKAWLFAIILRVASNQRRSVRRRGVFEHLGDQALASAQPGPFDLTARAQAAQFLHTFLSSLDESRRATFIMAELEQLTAPEIARVLGANLNTVYSWLRGARIAFSKALANIHAASGADHE